MSYFQLSDSTVSLISDRDVPLDGLQRVLLRLEGGIEPPRLYTTGAGEASRGHEPDTEDREQVVCPPSVGPDRDMVAQSSSCRLVVERPVYQHSGLHDAFFSRDPQPATATSRLLHAACECSPKQTLVGMVPAVTWLADYSWKDDLVKDIVSGCTVAIMNIPQGMAYALLGNVPPVVGIYMAIFPVLVYAFLGTSRHVAMGSFAVICLMTGKVVSELSGGGPPAPMFNSTSPTNTSLPVYSPLEVAVSVTFMVSIYQLLMYVFRMGIMCSLLSETLVNGFTAGAAIHVFTSQIKDLLGMDIRKHNGNFQIIYTYIEVFKNLSTINTAASIISLTTVVVLILDNKFVKPWVSRRSVIPVPVELIAVTVGTIASTFWDIHVKYNLTTVGHISIGLPGFHSPNFELIPAVAVDSFIIAVIAYIVTISMALIFAQKMKYEIDANQELLAQGAGNLVGSFLSCMPFAASLSRSMIQQTTGGRTQLASMICAAILTVVLVSFAPVFEPLPRCILASLIVVALKGILLQVKDIVKIWHMSTLDGIVWVATYVTVILVEIDVGLLVGLTVSIVTILFRGIRPLIYPLSRLPYTDIYVESTRYGKVEDINGVCIIHYGGGLNFANKSCFRQEVNRILNSNGVGEEKMELKTLPKFDSNKSLSIDMEKEITFLVLDLTGLQYVDPSGAEAIKALASELAARSTSIYLAGPSGSVCDVLQRCGVLNVAGLLCFPTVHDAVVFAQSKLPKIIHSIRL
ncbi:anion exchange transporter-like isoform X2 [Homalodisca vitripennis]|uniref:anion exchange transporter-like isoform X2 n=1 Tax=Homalodisca vitripennis TaxID=197043 RepID=UPI001EE9D725|nr:anion exchange transporter-like isoform X2 [Homalodisca vitripennis]